MQPRSETTADTALLDWLERHPQCELSHEGWDDDPRWQVHRVTGGRNDREWSVVGEGETVREAIRAAMDGMQRRSRARGSIPEVDLTSEAWRRTVEDDNARRAAAEDKR